MRIIIKLNRKINALFLIQSIQNERDLDKAIRKIDPYNFKWDLEATWMDPKFQSKEPYRHGDTIWKLDKTLIEPLGRELKIDI